MASTNSGIPSYAVNIISNVPLLSKDTYHTWKDGMTVFLLGVGADYVVEKVDSVPEGKGALDKQLILILWSKVESEYHHLFSDSTSALGIWKKIVNHFQKSTMAKRMKARQEFHHVTHDPSQPIEVYIHAVDKARQTLKDIGCVIDDVEALDVLLMNLDPSYHTIRTSILTAKDEPKLQDVKDILSGSSVSVINIKSEPVEFGMAAQNSGRRFGQSPAQGPGRSPPYPVDVDGFRWCDPTNSDHCHRCGRPGHIAAKCFADMPQHVRDWIMQGRSHYGNRQDKADMVEADHVASFVGVDPYSAFRSYRSRSPSSIHSSSSVHYRCSSPSSDTFGPIAL